MIKEIIIGKTTVPLDWFKKMTRANFISTCMKNPEMLKGNKDKEKILGDAYDTQHPKRKR